MLFSTSLAVFTNLWENLKSAGLSSPIVDLERASDEAFVRKNKYLHGAGVLNDRFPLVPIDFARGTEEFGGPDSRE